MTMYQVLGRLENGDWRELEIQEGHSNTHAASLVATAHAKRTGGESVYDEFVAVAIRNFEVLTPLIEMEPRVRMKPKAAPVEREAQVPLPV